MVVSASFEDYLYILAGVVWLIFSFYKGQKKKKTTSETSSQSGKKSFFESLVEEFDQEKAPDPVLYTPVEETFSGANAQQLAEERLFSYDDAVELSNEYETSVVYKETEVKKVEKPPVILSKVVKNQKNKIRQGFDLRKAVIYSEIINPRYF
ncbi:MAG: hypothetical protein KKF98_01465 [Bacteroidetes bacterium]|nr:hypothetical protein [Bacteroidota bacterium]